MAMAMAWTAGTVAALAMALVELAAVMVFRMATMAAHLRIRDGVTDARQCVSSVHRATCGMRRCWLARAHLHSRRPRRFPVAHLATG